MQERRVQHVGVERDGDVVGLISLSDLLAGPEQASLDELRAALRARDEALAISQRNLRLAEQIIESSPESVMITYADGVIQRINPAFTLVSGYVPEEVFGRRPSLLSSGRHTLPSTTACRHPSITRGIGREKSGTGARTGNSTPSC